MVMSKISKSAPIIQPSRYEVIWPDGSYSICSRQGDEWIVRMPDGNRYGATRLLSLWRRIHGAGGRINR